MDEHANQDEDDEKNRVASSWQNDRTLYEMRSHRGGEKNEGPIKQHEEEQGAHNSSNDESKPVVLARLDEKRSRDGNGKLSTGEESHDSDGDLLHEQGEESANKAEHNGNGEGEEGSRFVHDVRRQFDPGGETDRGDAEPEYAAAKK